ncbi:MAG: FlgD immunoglobulin-like domain containing protein [Bacteroidota bacterium]
MKRSNQMFIKFIFVLALVTSFQFTFGQLSQNDLESLFMNQNEGVTKYSDSFMQNERMQPQLTGQLANTAWDPVDEWVMMDTVFTATTPQMGQEYPEVAYGSDVYLVVWQDNRTGAFMVYDYDVYAARVTTSGEVLDPYGIKISANVGINEKEPSVAFDGTNFLVIWSDDRNGPNNYDIYGMRISPDGEILDPGGFPVCTASGFQTLTAISFNGTHYLASWSDFRPGDYDIYGARIDPDGTVLESDGFEIYSAPYNQAYVSVASDGDGWLLSWGAIGEIVIVGTRVDADGNVLDPNGFIISANESQRLFPDVGFDGTNYFVAWSDWRSGSTAEHWSIYGARVSPDGVVLDPDGIAIAADDSKFEVVPELFFDGTNYLVTYKDGGYTELAGVFVLPDGSISNPGGFSITGAPGGEHFHAICHDGTNWFLAWEDFRSSSARDIFGARIDASGNVLDPYPNDIPIILSATLQYSASAAYNGTDHLVIWQERVSNNNFDIRGTRVQADGTPMDSPALEICSYTYDQYYPVIASANSGYLAVWKDCRQDGIWGDIYASRISGDGIVLDPDGIAVSDASGEERLPAVASDGDAYFVIWWRYYSYDYHIFGSRVSADGLVLDPDGIDIATVQWDIGWNYFVDVSIAFDGENYLVVWSEFKLGSWDIYGTRVSTDGEVLDSPAIPISTVTNDQFFPQVTASNGQFLVCWTDERDGQRDIYAARIDAEGNVLDDNGIAVSTNGYDPTGVQLTFDGTAYVVVWSDTKNGNPDVFGTVVDLYGIVMDQEGIVFTTDPYFQNGPTISAGPDETSLVCYAGFEPETYLSTRVWGGIFTNTYTGIDESRLYPESKLLSNAPNPFNASTKIILDLPQSGDVRIDLFDITGRYVNTVHDGVLAAGHHEFVWNARNNEGRSLDPGVYFCRLSLNTHEEILKMILAE